MAGGCARRPLAIGKYAAGSWKIEHRSEDGALLHEDRFTVR